jgi:hypothetical protein
MCRWESYNRKVHSTSVLVRVMTTPVGVILPLWGRHLALLPLHVVSG